MGHLLVSTMKKIRAAVDTLSLEKDGVDGPGVYIYGAGPGVAQLCLGVCVWGGWGRCC
jgi:hypothetical protein